MRTLILFAACLSLAGCGSDPETAEQAPSAERVAPPDARPVIAAFGDSLSAGHGVDPGNSYPDFLQQMIDARGFRYRVVNAGISGDTSSGGVARLDSVLGLKPEIVVLELGANDGLRGLPLAATRANLDEMIVALKRAGAKVVLAGMTLPRNYGPDYIRRFEAIYTDLAKQHSVTLVPFLLAGVAESAEYMQPDRLHPTVEGNRRVAANVMKALEPLLR